MATFALFVQHDCIGTPVIAEIIRFCESAVACGHRVDHIFFYQDAVFCLTQQRFIATDEVNWMAQLEQTANKLSIELMYCTTAADRRGINDISQHCKGAGLAEFAMRAEICDRVIGF